MAVVKCECRHDACRSYVITGLVDSHFKPEDLDDIIEELEEFRESDEYAKAVRRVGGEE